MKTGFKQSTNVFVTLAVLTSILGWSTCVDGHPIDVEFISKARVQRVINRVFEHGDSVQRFQIGMLTVAMGGKLPTRSVSADFTSDSASGLVSELLQQNRIAAAIEIDSWRTSNLATRVDCCFGYAKFLSKEQIQEFTADQIGTHADYVAMVDVFAISELLFTYQEKVRDRFRDAKLYRRPGDYASTTRALLAIPEHSDFAKADFILALVCALEMCPSEFSDANVQEIRDLLTESGLGAAVYDRCLKLGWIRLAGAVLAGLGEDEHWRFSSFLASPHYLATQAFGSGLTNSRFSLLNEARLPAGLDIVDRLLSKCEGDPGFVVSHNDLRDFSEDHTRVRLIASFLEQLRFQAESSQFAKNLEAVRQYRKLVGDEMASEFVKSDLVDLDLTICSCLRSLGRERDASFCFDSIVRDVINSRVSGLLESDMPIPQSRPIVVRLLESSSIDPKSVSALHAFFSSQLRDSKSPWRNGAQFLESAGYVWEADDRNALDLDFIKHNPRFAPSFCTGVGRRLSRGYGINRTAESFILLNDAGLFEDPCCFIEFLRGLNSSSWKN